MWLKWIALIAVSGPTTLAIQTRSIFSVHGNWTNIYRIETILNGKPEPLRLLPQPLLVFGQAESEQEQGKRNESALFAMVTGTDAEVLLLIQAVENTSGRQATWRITPARFTSLTFEIKVRSKSIWKSEKVSGPSPFLSVHGLFFKPLDPR